MKKLKQLVENRGFQIAILAVICLNALMFGVQTSPDARAYFGRWFGIIDGLCLAVFTVELVLKIVVYNKKCLRARCIGCSA